MPSVGQMVGHNVRTRVLGPIQYPRVSYSPPVLDCALKGTVRVLQYCSPGLALGRIL